MTETPEKYAKSTLYGNGAFMFPRAEVKDKECLNTAFETHGLKIADIHYECFGMWVWVLTENGQLWLNDFSHGGGGVFTLQ